MGRSGSGVEVRPHSIRIAYSIPGQGRQRHTLTAGGAPLAPTPANVKYAHRVAAEIKTRIDRGTFNVLDYFPDADATAGTLSGQLDAWLAAQRITESTRAGYESAAKFWRASIGHIDIADLLTSHILTALAAKPSLSGKTVNNYVSVLREALQMAVVDRRLPSNPVTPVPRARHQKAPPDPFTADEAARIIGDFHARAPAQVANLVEFWFWTGMRTSEIAGLRWSNVDLSSGAAQVSEALVRGQSKSSTKTSTARTVRLNSVALASLKRQKEHTILAGHNVFLDPRYGTPWAEERAFRRSYWEPCLKRLGIRYRRPYNMRHTYATAMLMAGMNPAFCARQLGHSVQVFLTTYARWIDGARDDAEMGRLEALLPPVCPQGSKERRSTEGE